LHHFQWAANVDLLFAGQRNLVGGVVHASGVGVEQTVQNFGAATFRSGPGQFVLKFLQTIVGERNKQPDAIRRQGGVADFVGFVFGLIIFLFFLSGSVRRDKRGRHQ
jgi:hypothetical protein